MKTFNVQIDLSRFTPDNPPPDRTVYTVAAETMERAISAFRRENPALEIRSVVDLGVLIQDVP